MKNTFKTQSVPRIGIIALIAIIGLGFAGCETLGGLFQSDGGSGGGSSASGGGVQKEYAVGDKGPGGGIVFYDKGNDEGGWRYLEAAPEDVAGKHTWISPHWYKFGFGGLNWDIGNGKENTATILAVDAEAPAAKAAVDYRGGGLDDWFLPSGYEFEEMFKLNNQLNLKATYYWTSSEASLYNTYEKRIGRWDKEIEMNVRPVRAFLTSAQGAPAAPPVDQRESAAQFNWRNNFFNPSNQPSPAGVWLASGGTTYTLNANGTGSFRAAASDGWITVNVTWKASGNKFNLTYSGSTTVYTYEIKGNEFFLMPESNGTDFRFLQTWTRQ